jgi:signal recognition particle subunit SRP54
LKNSQVPIDNSAFVKVEAIVQSMTKAERSNPKIINGSRRQRIARGSGNSIQEVNKFLKQFEDMQKIMKSVALGKKHPFSSSFQRMFK